MFNHSNNSYS